MQHMALSSTNQDWPGRAMDACMHASMHGSMTLQWVGASWQCSLSSSYTPLAYWWHLHRRACMHGVLGLRRPNNTCMRKAAAT